MVSDRGRRRLKDGLNFAERRVKLPLMAAPQETGAMDPDRAAYHFDRFTLDLGRGILLGDGGAEVPLRPKSGSPDDPFKTAR